MKVIICGLGYVGVTAASCLIKDGHHVVGVDVNDVKIADVAAGKSPVSEPGRLYIQGGAMYRPGTGWGGYAKQDGRVHGHG